MFRRTFWFTAGAAAGVWATTKVHTKLRQLTPESLAAQAANKAVDKAVGAGHRLRDFALDVRAGMAQRESELGEALGLGAAVDRPELPAGRRLSAEALPERPYDKHTHDHDHMRGDRFSSRTPHNRNEDH